MIFVIKRGFHEERRSPVIIWLWFSSACFGEFPKIFSICEICPANHLKAEKIAVTNAVSLLFYILCFLPLSQIWSYEFLLSTGTREICRKVQQILGESTGKNALNCAWKILIFFVANITEWNRTSPISHTCAWVNFRICRFICRLSAIFVLSFRLISFSGATKSRTVKKSYGASLNKF